MNGKTNFHTHSVYCDGKDTLEELVEQALAMGMDALGFSGHSFTPFDQSYCMSLKDTLEYQKEVRALKEKYRGKIKLYLGIEQDFYSPESTDEYDYVIASVHYVKKNGEYLSIDESAEDLKSFARDFYQGDIYGLIEDYFQTVALMAQSKCAFIGHFDLIGKFQEQAPLFDENHPRYKQAAQSALDKLLQAGKVMEINTGAMARGYRTTPYPAENWLKEMVKNQGRLILSSDCHDKNYLTYGFDLPLMAKYEKYINKSI